MVYSKCLKEVDIDYDIVRSVDGEQHIIPQSFEGGVDLDAGDLGVPKFFDEEEDEDDSDAITNRLSEFRENTPVEEISRSTRSSLHSIIASGADVDSVVIDDFVFDFVYPKIIVEGDGVQGSFNIEVFEKFVGERGFIGPGGMGSPIDGDGGGMDGTTVTTTDNGALTSSWDSTVTAPTTHQQPQRTSRQSRERLTRE